MERPSMRLTSITIGTPDPGALAAFYADLLGLQVTSEEPDGEWAQIHAPEGSGPTLNFDFERHHAPPVWPARPGAQVATQHLDIWVQDLPAAVRWALQCGAVEAEVQPQPEVRVLIDPAGHPFCLFT